MSGEVLAELIKQNLEVPPEDGSGANFRVASDDNYPLASFAWQGGEPLLMGLDFFDRAMELMQKFGRKGHIISNSLQTNSLLLDKEWGRFLAQYRFLVGVSLDGPEEIHNKFRSDSFGQVMQGITVLRQHNVEFNILSVVNSLTVTQPNKIYDFFVSNGFQHLQFIPCMEETEELQQSRPYTITPEQYGAFLCGLFDAWLANGYPNVHIRLFDNVMEACLGREPSNCQMKSNCGDYVVIEHNGDAYPCDFFVYPEWKLGNILSQPLREIATGPRFKEFAQNKTHLQEKCQGCPWKLLCYGGCPRTRYFRQGSFDDLDYFCPAYEMFFQHSAEKFRELSGDFKPNG